MAPWYCVIVLAIKGTKLGLAVGALALLSQWVVGCKASVSVETKNSETPTAAAPSVEPTPLNVSKPTQFIGVTHQAFLKPEVASQPTCRCLALHAGPGGDPAFQWRGTPPPIGSDAFVLAISGDVTCDKPQSGKGPSIQGVERSENNVILWIEEARGERPLAQAAVVERPTVSGRGDIIVRTRRGLPYADALAGSPDRFCRIPIPLSYGSYDQTLCEKRVSRTSRLASFSVDRRAQSCRLSFARFEAFVRQTHRCV